MLFVCLHDFNFLITATCGFCWSWILLDIRGPITVNDLNDLAFLELLPTQSIYPVYHAPRVSLDLLFYNTLLLFDIYYRIARCPV